MPTTKPAVVCKTCLYSDLCFSALDDCQKYRQYRPAPMLSACFMLDNLVMQYAELMPILPEDGSFTFEAKRPRLCSTKPNTVKVSLMDPGGQDLATYDLERQGTGWQHNFQVRLGRDVFKGFCGVFPGRDGAVHGTVRLTFLYRAAAGGTL